MVERVKVVVTVPTAEADALRQAIGEAGAGVVGNYTFCSYSIVGIGRFKPNQDAKPFIGSAGQQEKVEEERIEVACDRREASSLVKAIRQAHPYEEPAIDVYPLLDV